jgi:hypothetical protein
VFFCRIRDHDGNGAAHQSEICCGSKKRNSTETKRQSKHWKTPTLPRMKEERVNRSQVKAMMIVSFDIKGVIMIE